MTPLEVYNWITGTPWVFGPLCGVGGALVSPFGDWITDWRHERRYKKDRQKLFAQMKREMPVLMEEITRDLREFPNRRDCFVVKGVLVGSNYPVFTYSAKEHPEYLGNFVRLESLEFVEDITPRDCPMYRFSEELVELVIS